MFGPLGVIERLAFQVQDSKLLIGQHILKIKILFYILQALIEVNPRVDNDRRYTLR